MSGNFIQVEAELVERNQWLDRNRRPLARYLRQGLECTVFTFSRDEPPDRAATRIGGQPYWPRERPWPVCRACSLVRPQPMQFISQLDFRGSSLHATVPGDVLAFHYCVSCSPSRADQVNVAETEAFRQRHGLAVPELPDSLAYVPGGGALTWNDVQPSGAELLSVSEIPAIEGAWEIAPFYGTPHRAVDYPTPKAAYGGRLGGEEYTYLHFTLQGTKIGGYPPPIQDFRVPVDAARRPMRFLGTLGSVTSSAVDGPGCSDSRGDFMWGDMGCLYLWISDATPSREMAWFWRCY